MSRTIGEQILQLARAQRVAYSLQGLQGATVQQARCEYDDFGEWPVLVLRLRDGQTVDVTVQADAEGNGPGFLEGVPKVER